MSKYPKLKQYHHKCSVCGRTIWGEQACYYRGKWYCDECESALWKIIRYDYLEDTDG